MNNSTPSIRESPTQLVKVGARHQVTIPKKIVEQIALKAGGYVSVALINNNIIISPKAIVDTDEAWYWSKEWQAKEREVDEALAKGDYQEFDNAEDLIKALHA